MSNNLLFFNRDVTPCNEMEAWWNLINCVVNFLGASTTLASSLQSNHAILQEQIPFAKPERLLIKAPPPQETFLTDFPWFINELSDKQSSENISGALKNTLTKNVYEVIYNYCPVPEKCQVLDEYHGEPSQLPQHVNINDTQEIGDDPGKNLSHVTNEASTDSEPEVIDLSTDTVVDIRQGSTDLFNQQPFTSGTTFTQFTKKNVVENCPKSVPEIAISSIDECSQEEDTMNVVELSSIACEKTVSSELCVEMEDQCNKKIKLYDSEESCFFEEYTDSEQTIDSSNLQCNYEQAQDIEKASEENTEMVKSILLENIHVICDQGAREYVNVSVAVDNSNIQVVQETIDEMLDSKNNDIELKCAEIQTYGTSRYKSTVKALIAKSAELHELQTLIRDEVKLAEQKKDFRKKEDKDTVGMSSHSNHSQKVESSVELNKEDSEKKEKDVLAAQPQVHQNQKGKPGVIPKNLSELKMQLDSINQNSSCSKAKLVQKKSSDDSKKATKNHLSKMNKPNANLIEKRVSQIDPNATVVKPPNATSKTITKTSGRYSAVESVVKKFINQHRITEFKKPTTAPKLVAVNQKQTKKPLVFVGPGSQKGGNTVKEKTEAARSNISHNQPKVAAQSKLAGQSKLVRQAKVMGQAKVLVGNKPQETKVDTSTAKNTRQTVPPLKKPLLIKTPEFLEKRGSEKCSTQDVGLRKLPILQKKVEFKKDLSKTLGPHRSRSRSRSPAKKQLGEPK